MFGLKLCNQDNMISATVGKVMESIYAKAPEKLSDEGDQSR